MARRKKAGLAGFRCYRGYLFQSVPGSTIGRVRVFRPVAGGYEFDFYAGIRCAVKFVNRTIKGVW